MLSLLICIFQIISATCLYAQSQETFFLPSNLKKSDLKSTQLTRFEKSESSELTKSIDFIDISGFAEQVADQVLEIQIPGVSLPALYHARYVWSPSPDDITWYGDLIDSTGFASFQLKDGELSGYFNFEERDFFIRPIGEDAYILVEQNEEDAAVCGYHQQETSIEFEQEVEQSSVSEREENCDVKVLVLYTNKAAEDVDNMTTFILGLIAQSNQALRNSGISSSELTFIYAGNSLLSEFTETDDISNDLTTFRTSPTVSSLRAQFTADCVVLLTDGNYSMSSGNVYGLTPSCGPSSSMAFSIVEADQAATRMTFAHELAHQFGCKHSPGMNNGGCEPSFERPHWFNHNWRDRYTIMEAGVKKKQRIPHFSNPDVSYHGHPTGTHADPSGNVERDNARQLREQACVVGQFLTSNDLRAIIYGDDHICVSSLSIPIPLVAQASGGGPGPYTYLWQISNDGINYNPTPLSTTDNALVPTPTTLEAGDIIFIKLTVVSGTGQIYVTYQEIRVLPLESPDCDGGNKRSAEYKKPDSTGTAFSVFPNPANDYFSVVLNHITIDEAISVELISLDGTQQKMLTFNGELEQVDFATSDLANGTYLIRLKSKTLNETQKLVIVR